MPSDIQLVRQAGSVAKIADSSPKNIAKNIVESTNYAINNLVYTKISEETVIIFNDFIECLKEHGFNVEVLIRYIAITAVCMVVTNWLVAIKNYFLCETLGWIYKLPSLICDMCVACKSSSDSSSSCSSNSDEESSCDDKKSTSHVKTSKTNKSSSFICKQKPMVW